MTEYVLQVGQVFCLAFPNNDDSPSTLPERARSALVASDVGLKFIGPEIHVRFRCGRFSATDVTMPETAVDEDAGSVLGEHQIWRAGQVLPMKTKSQSGRVRRAPYKELGICVFPPNGPHTRGSRFTTKPVHQES